MSPTRRWMSCVLPGAVLVQVLATHPALAAWPHDPNVNLPVCTASGAQSLAVPVPDGSGGAIMAWSDQRSGTYDIYAQRVDVHGATRWTANGIPLCSATGDQYLAFGATDGAGGAIFAWPDSRSGGFDIYAQRVNANGVVQWAANGIPVCTATGDQSADLVTGDGAGGLFVVWQDRRSGTNDDLYAQHLNGAGTALWAANGVPVCTAAGDQDLSVGCLIADGTGGLIVAWIDARAGAANSDIYAQRLNASGAMMWTTTGQPVCVQPGNQYAPHVVTDGAGGALLAWVDHRDGVAYHPYAQRLNASGLPLWPTDGNLVDSGPSPDPYVGLADDGVGGAYVVVEKQVSDLDIAAHHLTGSGFDTFGATGVPVCSQIGPQDYPEAISDGAGGAIAIWEDWRANSPSDIKDIYAQRILPSGATSWTGDGVAISTAIRGQNLAFACTDGNAGAIITFDDTRSGTDVPANLDVYAQRVERLGKLGNPEPAITAVRDDAPHTGARLAGAWNASYLDVVPGSEISQYSLWRQVPTANALARLATGGSRLATGVGDRPGHALRTTIAQGATYYWEYVASQPSRGFAGYSMTAATAGDSTGSGNPYTRFMVLAEQNFNGYDWASAPDSGYSVDNLPPATPAPFTGAYRNGATALHWGADADVDLAQYRLYRGNSAGFVPGPGNLIAARSDTGYTDVGPAGGYYKLTAIDIHGNESAAALLAPTGTTAVPDARGALALARAMPDPAPGATELGFTLSRPGAATLAVFDPQGRRVATLASGAFGAGDHRVRWDGRGADGSHVGSGVYLIRLEAENRVLQGRFTLLH